MPHFDDRGKHDTTGGYISGCRGFKTEFETGKQGWNMPQPRVIKSVELPRDPGKAREAIADLKQQALKHEGARVVANHYEAMILQPPVEALAEDEVKAKTLSRQN